MFKTLIFTVTLLFSGLSFSKVQMRWLSITSVLIEDGKTRLLFDAAYTRPNRRHWLNLDKFKSDQALVESVLKKNEITALDAIFVGHSHFDHVVDAPIVAKLTGAVFFADKSNARIANAYQDPNIKIMPFEPRKKIKLGDFTVIVLPQVHPKIAGLFHFLKGPVPKDFDFGFYEYRTGNMWSYLIIHPAGVVVVDAQPAGNLKEVLPIVSRVDAVIQGVANRRNDEQVLNSYLKQFKPRIFIPTHFDNFFLPLDPERERLLPGINLKRLLKKAGEDYPGSIIKEPKFGEKILLLN